MACIDENHCFVLVNKAFERLLGYSSTELFGNTWMEITAQRDVGGDLASVEALIEGKIDSYTLEKDYVHKRGRSVPVVLTVRRFPRASHLPLLYMSKEAPVSTITRPEVVSLERELRAELQRISKQLQTAGVSVNVGDKVGGDKVGRDKNSDAAIKVIAGSMVAVSLAISWLFYYVATAVNKTTPEPPRVHKVGEP